MILVDYSAIAISNVVTQKLDIEEDLIRHMILNSLRMHRAKHREKFGELVLCIDGSKNWRKRFILNTNINVKMLVKSLRWTGVKSSVL